MWWRSTKCKTPMQRTTSEFHTSWQRCNPFCDMSRLWIAARRFRTYYSTGGSSRNSGRLCFRYSLQLDCDKSVVGSSALVCAPEARQEHAYLSASKEHIFCFLCSGSWTRSGSCRFFLAGSSACFATPPDNPRTWCAGLACQRCVAVCPPALAHTGRMPAQGLFLVLRPEQYRLSISAPQIPLQRAYSFPGTVVECFYGHRCCGQTPPKMWSSRKVIQLCGKHYRKARKLSSASASCTSCCATTSRSPFRLRWYLRCKSCIPFGLANGKYAGMNLCVGCCG